MPIRPLVFDEVASLLAPLLYGLPGRLVAIDGRMGAGKTTLGRFLAWYFNVTLVETDPFLLGDGTLSRHLDEIGRIVGFRLDGRYPRPVLVEGVGVLDLLEQLRRTADAHIYVENTSNPVSPSDAVLAYERRTAPIQRADFVVRVAHDG